MKNSGKIQILDRILDGDGNDLDPMLKTKKPDGTLSWNNIESLNVSRSGSPSMHG